MISKIVKFLVERCPRLVKFLMNIKNFFRSIHGLVTLAHQSKKDESQVKVVVFMCQYIPAWDKMKCTYEAMLKDKRFKPLLVCVPSDVNAKCSHNDNDTYKYYINNSYENVLNALDENDNWISLKKLGADYVFYCRPYNHFMPKLYSARKVSKYARICVILYAYLLTEDIVKVVMHKDFFPYVSIYFAESEHTKEYFVKYNKLGCRLGLQKGVFGGVPVLESLYQLEEQTSASWSYSHNDFRVVWSPRWTTDPKIGGSSFLPFHKDFLAFAEENKDLDVLIRPHPLMFDNLLNTGKMTLEEIESFKQTCKETSNVRIDEEKDYISTLWQSDVLVSDISSIMTEYLAMGKPIIYVDWENDSVFTPAMQAMLDVCYVVHSFEEMSATVLNLKAGNDYLKDKRLEVAEKYFKLEESKNLSKKILDSLI